EDAIDRLTLERQILGARPYETRRGQRGPRTRDHADGRIDPDRGAAVPGERVEPVARAAPDLEDANRLVGARELEDHAPEPAVRVQAVAAVVAGRDRLVIRSAPPGFGTHPRVEPCYSDRRASTGSIRVARAAGITVARSAKATTMAADRASTSGSEARIA